MSTSHNLPNLWQSLAVPVASGIFAWLSTIFVFALNSRRELKVKTLEAEAERRRQHVEFQKKTLMDLQDLLPPLREDAYSIYVLRNSRDPAKYPYPHQPEDMSAELKFRSSLDRAELLVQRIEDETSRDLAHQYLSSCFTIPASERSTPQLGENLMESANKSTALGERIGVVLRELYR